MITQTRTPSPSRGSFIVLEGVDRCGKTTQVARLVSHCLSLGLAASAWRFPNRNTATGQIINQYLQSQQQLSDQAIHLLFSANRWEAAQELSQSLQAGQTVICDRYAFSGVAFSAAKPGLSLDWCKAPDVGLPAPDVVVFLDLEPSAAEARGGYGEEVYEQADFQTRVRQRFGELQNDKTVNWHVVNAGQTMDEVQTDIWKIVDQVMKTVEREQRPIGKLWVEEKPKESSQQVEE